MKQITKSIFLVCLILATLAFISCEDEPTYNQLTADQLRHLYLVDSNYHYSGETEEFQGTIQFLKNEQEIIEIEVVTKMSAAPTSSWASANRFNVRGSSELDLTEEGFQITSVEIANTSSLSVGAFGDIYFFDSSIPLPTIGNPNLEFKELDPAMINGVIYDEVYKFNTEDLEQYQFEFDGFDRIYFAKDFGYLLIETFDGLKLELITE